MASCFLFSPCRQHHQNLGGKHLKPDLEAAIEKINERTQKKVAREGLLESRAAPTKKKLLKPTSQAKRRKKLTAEEQAQLEAEQDAMFAQAHANTASHLPPSVPSGT